jgi:hypothetical protein
VTPAVDGAPTARQSNRIAKAQRKKQTRHDCEINAREETAAEHSPAQGPPVKHTRTIGCGVDMILALLRQQGFLTS